MIVFGQPLTNEGFEARIELGRHQVTTEGNNMVDPASRLFAGNPSLGVILTPAREHSRDPFVGSRSSVHRNQMKLIFNRACPLGVEFDGKATRAQDREMRVRQGAMRFKSRMMFMAMNEDIKAVLVQNPKEVLSICHQAKVWDFGYRVRKVKSVMVN
jgi:hypothetical protein